MLTHWKQQTSTLDYGSDGNQEAGQQVDEPGQNVIEESVINKKDFLKVTYSTFNASLNKY